MQTPSLPYCDLDPPVPCVDIVEGWGQGKALWKSQCQLLGLGDPVSKSQGDLSFLKCGCHLMIVMLTLYCTRSSIDSLKRTICTHLPYRLQLPAFVLSFGILSRHRMKIWLRVFQMVSPALYPLWFGGRLFLRSRL